MKYFAFLLSIYVFYLVSAPCVDEPLHISNPGSGQTSEHDPCNSGDHADDCSPFCICSCCSVTVTIVQGTFVSQPYYCFQRSILTEFSPSVSSFSVAFWQPPKIG